MHTNTTGLRLLGVDFYRLVGTTSDEPRSSLIERRAEHALRRQRNQSFDNIQLLRLVIQAEGYL